MTFGFDRVVVRVLGISITSSRDWDLIYVALGIAIAAEILRRRPGFVTEEPLTFGSDVAEHVTGASFHLFNSAQQEWNRDLLRSICRGGASYGISPARRCVAR